MGRRRASLAVVAALLAVAGCGDDETDRASARPLPGAPPRAEPRDTPRFDAMAVVGHSGATGTGTNPHDPYIDAPQNSWATGDNPEVESIYQRLLATHPALEGHNYNAAVNGSSVLDHVGQAVSVMEKDPVPDLVIVQTIDNDQQCDGTDRQHVEEFADGLAELIRTVTDASEHTQVFLPSQWATVEEYADTVQGEQNAVAANAGTGPCDIFDPQGRPNQHGRASLQKIVAMYWKSVEATCARFPRCFTDGGVMTSMKVDLSDLNSDFNHLSVSGHRKYAALAWSALPAEIRDRP
jgi:hypothetical protein